MKRSEEAIHALLAEAGIEVNGPAPSDIQIYHKDLYKRVLQKGSLGLGEAYMDGWWDAGELDAFFYRVLRASLDEKAKNWKILAHALKSILLNSGKRSRAFEVGEKHYDIGNDLFRYMLDKRMVYSCAYWKEAGNLDEAQEAKLELICKKLKLEPGMKVLDIGCGWGSFCKYAAENYGAEVVGITISKEQVSLAREACKGLNVKILLRDYREMKASDLPDSGRLFDRIVSVGMIEHVGYKNYLTFMKSAYQLLEDEGIFLLHTIGGNKSSVNADRWINKYIFPNGMLPSIKQIGKATEGLFVMEDWHNFGVHYDRTLMAWFRNFEQAWRQLKENYDDRFYRMWKYYLLSCAGSFRARKNQLWQIVLSKNGLPGGYEPVL